jgi:uncharacterized protein YkwD
MWLGLLAVLGTHPARAEAPPPGAQAACQDRYHQEAKLLTNPDENILIAEIIGWCRKQEHRLLWDERYALAARVWSGHLLEAKVDEERSLPIERIRFELLQRGVTDAAVLPFSALGPVERTPEGLTTFLDEQARRGRYTHFGVGVARQPDQQRMMTTLILGRRPALLEPLPVCPAPGTRLPLRAQLLRGHNHPRWLLATPRGEVQSGALLYEEGAWHGEVPLDAGRGEYTLEVTVLGPTGPQVASLFPLYAGLPRERLPRIKLRPGPERYKNPEEAERALFDLLNGLRTRQKLPPLALQARLSEVAREHAMQLLVERHAVHRTRQGGSLVDRLKRSGVSFARALENVALVPSPEAAHDRFEQSPGHRVNMVDPDATLVGLGVAMERGPSEDIVAVCQVFVEPVESGASAQLARRVWQVINERRKARGRFALGLDEELSRAALHSARRLAAMGARSDPQEEGAWLLEELGEDGLGVQGAQVRYFRTARPSQVLQAPELLDESINRLGVGVARTADFASTGEVWIGLVFAGR